MTKKHSSGLGSKSGKAIISKHKYTKLYKGADDELSIQTGLVFTGKKTVEKFYSDKKLSQDLMTQFNTLALAGTENEPSASELATAKAEYNKTYQLLSQLSQSIPEYKVFLTNLERSMLAKVKDKNLVKFFEQTAFVLQSDASSHTDPSLVLNTDSLTALKASRDKLKAATEQTLALDLRSASTVLNDIQNQLFTNLKTSRIELFNDQMKTVKSGIWNAVANGNDLDALHTSIQDAVSGFDDPLVSEYSALKTSFDGSDTQIAKLQEWITTAQTAADNYQQITNKWESFHQKFAGVIRNSAQLTAELNRGKRYKLTHKVSQIKRPYSQRNIMKWSKTLPLKPLRQRNEVSTVSSPKLRMHFSYMHKEIKSNYKKYYEIINLSFRTDLLI